MPVPEMYVYTYKQDVGRLSGVDVPKEGANTRLVASSFTVALLTFFTSSPASGFFS